jgi:hypothetical protein
MKEVNIDEVKRKEGKMKVKKCKELKINDTIVYYIKEKDILQTGKIIKILRDFITNQPTDYIVENGNIVNKKNVIWIIK